MQLQNFIIVTLRYMYILFLLVTEFNCIHFCVPRRVKMEVLGFLDLPDLKVNPDIVENMAYMANEVWLETMESRDFLVQREQSDFRVQQVDLAPPDVLVLMGSKVNREKRGL